MGAFCQHLPSEDHGPAPGELGPESMAYLEIYKKFSAHPAPDGRVELALRMVRQVRGEYSRIPLKVMHELAKKAGVPFNGIGESELSTPTTIEEPLCLGCEGLQ